MKTIAATPMKAALRSLAVTLAASLAATSWAGDEAKGPDKAGSSFRKPFTLTLQIDKNKQYEEKFEKHPYVHKNNVFLFSGDDFGVSLLRDGAAIKSVTYQPDSAKADITMKFSQELKDGVPSMMMLVIKNNTKDTIYMDALMTMPGKKGAFKTTILPLGPGLSGYESWPHPIVQLILTNIRTTK